MGSKHHFFGKHHTPKTIAKMSLAKKGKYFSLEHRAKISMALKGHLGTHYTHTPETKAKLSLANKGKRLSDETKTKISVSRAKQITPVKDTIIEVKIQDYLKALELDFEAHHYMRIDHAYQCDMYIPSLNMVIECDGDYWHCYPTGKEIDHLRTKELTEKGYNVLRLWEHEIREMTTEDLKQKILSCSSKSLVSQ